jgi:predicted dinucleotide-binding enzyme
MNITIIGTGTVAQSLAEKFIALSHNVVLGTRAPEEKKADQIPNPITGRSFQNWYRVNNNVKLAALKDSAQDADLIVNATQGVVSLELLLEVGRPAMAGKILIDIANPFDTSKGVMTICNTDSLGEQLQAAFPETKVVKSLNTMNAYIMTHPESIPDQHNVFLSGNDLESKREVKLLLKSMGWKDEQFIDLGDISTSRGTELLLPIGLRLYAAFGHSNFNFHIQTANQ